MALETLEEIYDAARRLPRDEQVRLMERLNGQVSEKGDDDRPEERAEQTDAALAGGSVERRKKLPKWATTLIEAGQQLEAQGLRLPSDFAAEHDHYIYGTPKRNC